MFLECSSNPNTLKTMMLSCTGACRIATKCCNAYDIVIIVGAIKDDNRPSDEPLRTKKLVEPVSPPRHAPERDGISMNPRHIRVHVASMSTQP